MARICWQGKIYPAVNKETLDRAAISCYPLINS